MALGPFLAILYFVSTDYLKQNNMVFESEKVAQIVELSTYIGNFVHETQKERAMSAGFLGSGGSAFSLEMTQQRKKADAAILLFRTYISKLST